MKVIPITYSDGTALSRELFSLGVEGSTLEIGTASFPAGARSPVEGFHVRSSHEVSFILEGAFDTECGGVSRVVRAGELVSIPAGEPNASRALSNSRVIYLMYKAAGSPK
jgi:quercetin dioxygenase-like cupin family protein